MYLPKHFASDNLDHIYALVREYPFASLISVDTDQEPFITHLPTHLEVRGDQAYILAHVAKPNPHWQLLEDQPKAKIVFMGPEAYMSPTVYADKLNVPTWNYLVVHAQVESRLLEIPADKDALLKKLIGDHEPSYAEQWRGLGEEYQQKMLRGIVGLEFKVLNWTAKFKLNEHRPQVHQAMYGQYQESTPKLAEWMRRLGMV